MQLTNFSSKSTWNSETDFRFDGTNFWLNFLDQTQTKKLNKSKKPSATIASVFDKSNLMEREKIKTELILITDPVSETQAREFFELDKCQTFVACW